MTIHPVTLSSSVMRTFILGFFSFSSLVGFSFSKPEVVVEFTTGSGPYQLGLTEEDVAVGPYRLVATGSTLYLLDQLNQRVSVYDTLGNFITENKLPFRAADMAVDNRNRIWLLENRTQPAEVVTLENGEEMCKLSIEYEVTEPVTAIVVHPPESLLAISGNKVFLATFEDDEAQSVYPAKATLAELDLDSLGALEVSGARFMGVQTDYSGRITEYLLAYGSGMLWIGEEQYIQDKSGSFTMRYVKILSESTDPPPHISIPTSYHSYDVGWRNLSIDPRGNVYLLVTEKEGTAKILRWVLSL